MTLALVLFLFFLLNNQIEQQLQANLRGVDMVVGSKGSPLQLILSSIYHIDNPTGNIPYREAIKIDNNPLVDLLFHFLLETLIMISNRWNNTPIPSCMK